MTPDVYTVRLRPAGSLTLAVSVDLFGLDDADRAFVLALVDMVRRHGERPAEPDR